MFTFAIYVPSVYLYNLRSKYFYLYNLCSNWRRFGCGHGIRGLRKLRVMLVGSCHCDCHQRCGTEGTTYAQTVRCGNGQGIAADGTCVELHDGFDGASGGIDGKVVVGVAAWKWTAFSSHIYIDVVSIRSQEMSLVKYNSYSCVNSNFTQSRRAYFKEMISMSQRNGNWATKCRMSHTFVQF